MGEETSGGPFWKFEKEAEDLKDGTLGSHVSLKLVSYTPEI